MTDRDVTPDDVLLRQIFTDAQPETTSVFIQTWTKCVFKAEFAQNTETGKPTCVVRLESDNESSRQFSMIMAIQKITASVIPELVPQAQRVGKANNAQGKMFNFLVVEFVEGELLNDVWEQMSTENRGSVVAEIVEALNRLHSLQINGEHIKEILRSGAGDDIVKDLEQSHVFGGPHTGFVTQGHTLLESIVNRRKLKKPFCTVETISESRDIRIQSKFQQLGSINIKSSEMDKWSGESVFCHNDLNPRNLILRPYTSAHGKLQYKLAGIIDWELAGFYPAAYELSLQDTYLGGGNRHVSFYLLLKDRMKSLVPQSKSQVILLQAMELIHESQQKMLSDGLNVGAHLRQRFLEQLQLVRDDDPYTGWTRNTFEEPVDDFSENAFQKLIEDVINEMTARRKSS